MNMIIKDQNVSKGSSHLKKQTEGFSIQNYMISNMQYNAAYVNHILKNNLKDNDKEILDDFKQRYSDYRNKCRKNSQKLDDSSTKTINTKKKKRTTSGFADAFSDSESTY